MPDQADILRQLVRQTVHSLPMLEPQVPLVVVSGGARGVGTSTVTWQLAQELASLGQRVVLVDADLTQPDLTQRLATTRSGCLGDVLSGARTAVEVIAPVGERLGFLPACWEPAAPPDLQYPSVQHFLGELGNLGSQADVVLLDAGQGMSPWGQCLWQAAQQILLVTSTRPTVVTDSYAMIKQAAGDAAESKLRLVVNQGEDPDTATRVGQKFQATCRQFLGLQIDAPVTLPLPAEPAGSGDRSLGDENREFHQAVRLLAADLLRQYLVVSHRLQRPTAPSAASTVAQRLKNSLSIAE